MKETLSTSYRAILKLALPVSAGTFTQFLVVLTDNFFLSQVSDATLNGAGNAGICTSPWLWSGKACPASDKS